MPANKKWLFRNNARSTLKNAILATDLTLTLNTGDGDRYFPSPDSTVNEAFRVTLIDASGNIEIIEVLQRTAGTDIFQVITRGVEGTIPLAFAAGSRVSMRVTKEIFEFFRDQFMTGDFRMTMRNAAAVGWRLCDDGTIGNVASGATYAAADAKALYTLLWTNVADANAPVTGGRGVSAAADWAALKKIALTKMLGRALCSTGFGAGLTNRQLGDQLGEENHLLTNAEVPATNVTITDPQHRHAPANGSFYDHIAGASTESYNAGASGPSIDNFTAFASTGITAVVAGGGGSHNNNGPRSFVNVEIHL